jgi:serine/threonine-protein kinase
MALTIGTQFGSHEIISLLGKGGMGEVYRARDTKLKREVAIKILPDEFSNDPSRVSRFQREAEVLASLNHPNIAAIYDLQEVNDTRFLVLELVEGETLAERIQRGAIPVEEVLDITKHICEALEAAHEKGIVHRDLKPANVKITPDGRVKVLDFGLAKALETQSTSTTLSNSPTMLSGTNGGMLVGTAAYMSPEQARGRSADQRSDVFAFGCVLFEMLAGQQAFQGEDVSDVLASVIKADADFNLLPPNLNPRLYELLRRCLAKNRRERWHAIADIRIELEAIISDPHGLNIETPRGLEYRPLWRRAFPFVLTGFLFSTVAVVITLVKLKTRPSAPAIVARFSLGLPEGQRFTNTGRHAIAFSPDGINVVYSANQQLYLRAMGEIEARPIQGTRQEGQGVDTPFFSPDGRWIGFFSLTDATIKKVPVTGGVAEKICDADDPFGAVWSVDDQIFIGQGPKGILRVSAKGGKPETIVSVKSGEAAHGPQLLPDNDGLLFTLALGGGASRWDTAQVVVQSLKSGLRKLLIENASDARYVPSGHIVYAQGSMLFAAAFDVRTLKVLGNAFPVADDVMRSSDNTTAAAQFSLSTNGSMVHILGGSIAAGDVTLVLVDRAGIRKPINIPTGRYRQVRISPKNGTQLAVDTYEDKNRSVSIYDLTGAAPMRRLTLGGQNYAPAWSADGQRVAFISDREGDPGLFWQRADGSGSAERLARTEHGIIPVQTDSWSPDENVLIFSASDGRIGHRSLGMVSLGDGERKPRPLIPNAANASLSPDGQWLAYASAAESGEFEVYVQRFPLTDERHQISHGGGSNPLWSPDRKQTQLFYLTPRRQMVAVDIQTQPSLLPLKTTPLPIEGIASTGPRPYDITPDGKQFVVLIPRSQADPKAPEHINITLNWFTVLQERVPVK